MWKTRFEVSSSNNGNGLTRHRSLSSSSSTIIHHYYSRSSPTVPRVREDSPSAVDRPSPPSSIPNLEILTEEEDEEDISCSTVTNNEQPSFVSITLRKQNSYQTINRRQSALPTIVESNDYEVMVDTMPNKNDINMINNESIDDKHSKYVVKLKSQESFVATNTNYNQVMNVDFERKERTLKTNKNNDMIEFTLDKRINELLQQKRQRQNKFTSSTRDVDRTELIIPTTFKDISAFFENKVLAASTTNISEQKKMVRAKRSISLNRQMPINNNDLQKLEIISSIKKESTIFHHQIKRIKTTHKSEFHTIAESELILNDSIAERSINCDHSIESKQLPIIMNKISLKKTLTKRWFIFVLLTVTILVYFYSKIGKDTFRLSPSYFAPQQFEQPVHLINTNVISRYGQFVRNHFFATLDLFVIFIGQLFFRIDKYEYKNNISYVATSTYEQMYDWFMHLFKPQYI